MEKDNKNAIIYGVHGNKNNLENGKEGNILYKMQLLLLKGPFQSLFNEGMTSHFFKKGNKNERIFNASKQFNISTRTLQVLTNEMLPNGFQFYVRGIRTM